MYKRLSGGGSGPTLPWWDVAPRKVGSSRPEVGQTAVARRSERIRRDEESTGRTQTPRWWDLSDGVDRGELLVLNPAARRVRPNPQLPPLPEPPTTTAPIEARAAAPATVSRPAPPVPLVASTPGAALRRIMNPTPPGEIALPPLSARPASAVAGTAQAEAVAREAGAVEAGAGSRRGRGWAIITAYLALLIVVTSYGLNWVPRFEWSLYLIQPVLWLSLALLALWVARAGYGRGILSGLDGWLMAMAILLGLCQVIVFNMVGFLVGFGNSPSAREPLLVAGNLWFAGTRLLGLELARWQIVECLGRRNRTLGIGLAWLAIFIASVPVNVFGLLFGAPEVTARMLGGTILPAAAQNVVATYLVTIGGPVASIGYLAVLAFFEWVPPILPKLPWYLTAFLGTMIPVLGLIVARDVDAWRRGWNGEASREGAGGTGWVFAVAVLVFVIWFNTGAFGVRPSLVSGHSMEPTLYLGDVVIVQPVAPDEVQVGDIICFLNGDSLLIHRVKEMRQEKGKAFFITQGDNNNVEDAPVYPQQLQGRLVATIPKIGWLSIAVKTALGQVR